MPEKLLPLDVHIIEYSKMKSFLLTYSNTNSIIKVKKIFKNEYEGGVENEIEG